MKGMDQTMMALIIFLIIIIIGSVLLLSIVGNVGGQTQSGCNGITDYIWSKVKGVFTGSSSIGSGANARC